MLEEVLREFRHAVAEGDQQFAMLDGVLEYRDGLGLVEVDVSVRACDDQDVWHSVCY